MPRRFNWLAVFIALAMFAGVAPAQTEKQTDKKGPAKNVKTASADTAADSAEADKVLYEKAMNDLRHNRFELARLSMQTLINTYPDSEYLAKAKLAIADSYYKEGGGTGMTQAVAEYQDFITFFPFLEEAAYAQMQIGMAHYRRMEKPDRDRSEALEAEAAFQTFLQKYPNTELTPKAEQRLREVQEVLAEGDYRIASFYYLRRIDKAAAPRLADLVNRYPLYSAADRANWMLGEIYERNKRNDLAATYYARVVKEYPLSSLAGDAKEKLVKFGSPVPDPDPVALARMKREQQLPRDRGNIFLAMPGALLHSGPDVSVAARVGMPTLTPETEDMNDTLSPGAGLSVVASGAGASATSGGGGGYVPMASSGGSDTASQSSANPATAPTAPGAPDPSVAATQNPANQSAPAANASPDSSATNADPSASSSTSSSTSSSQATTAGESTSNKKKKKNKK